MKTYISLASSATMFPVGSPILTSALTPAQVQDRMAKVTVVSVLNPDHRATVDAIKRRYGLELPIPALTPGQRAPQVKLGPGDELFIVQATLPRPKEGEVHSDETVNTAPISFLRWRVPVRVEVKAPPMIPQAVFDQIIDYAHSIALWQRGEDHLKDEATLLSDLAEEHDELDQDIDLTDAYLEASDVFYKLCCHWYATSGKSKAMRSSLLVMREIFQAGFNEDVDLVKVIDVLLVKYGRLASGASQDNEADRRLIAPLF